MDNSDLDRRLTWTETWASRAATERLSELEASRKHAVEEAVSHRTYSVVADPISAIPDGPLCGLPVAVKENIDVAGMPTITETTYHEGSDAEIDAGIVATLRNAGATFVGKTASFEVAFSPRTDGSMGPARNPIDIERIAGGSSGASAATVALGTVPVGIATDTSGSTLVPAAFCGVVGYRATVNRYPVDGVSLHSWTRDTIGIHAQGVSQIERIDQLMTLEQRGAESEPSEIRVGVMEERFRYLDDEVEAAMNSALDVLSGAGLKLVKVGIPGELEMAGEAGMALVLWETERLLRQRTTTRAGSPTPTLSELVNSAASDDLRSLLEFIRQRSIDPGTYTAAQQSRAQLRRLYSRLFRENEIDVLLFPTCPIVAPRLGTDVVDVGGKAMPLRAALVRNTTPGTVAGLPMISVPAITMPGAMPVGLCLEALPWSDRSLMDGARLLSDVLGV